MAYSLDLQRRRLLSPLNTISPSQANVTPAKRTMEDVPWNKDTFRDRTLLYEKENIHVTPGKVQSGIEKIQNLSNFHSRNNCDYNDTTDSKFLTNRTTQSNEYPVLQQNGFQGTGSLLSYILNTKYLPGRSLSEAETFELRTVKLVKEAQAFIEKLRLNFFWNNLETFAPLHNEYITYELSQKVKIPQTSECHRPQTEQVDNYPLLEEILDCISSTNKFLESQIEEQHSMKAKIEQYKNYRQADNNWVESFDSAATTTPSQDPQEELFYYIEGLQIENRRLRLEAEQLEQELREISYLREIETLAADATISEKNEELSRLRENHSPRRKSTDKQIESKSHFEDVDGFETPEVTRKFLQEAIPTPSSIIDTRRRLNACINYLLEERSETRRFEYIERVTYEERLDQLQSKIFEYEGHVNSLSSCLDEKLRELEVSRNDYSKLSEALSEKAQQLLSTSLQLEKLREEVKERDHVIDCLKKQLHETSSARTELSESLQKTNDEVLSLREKAENLQARSDEMKAQLVEKETELETLKKEVFRKDEQLASSYSSLSEMRSKLLKMENELEQATEAARWRESQYQSQVNSLTEELRQCESRLEVEKSENKALLEAVQSEKADKAALVSEMNSLFEENQKLSQQVTCLHKSDEEEKDLAESRKRISVLENELRKKEFEYSILQNDYAELQMKLEMERDHIQVVDEDTISLEQKKRQEAERESAELKDELRKLTQFIKKYRERTESKMINLRTVICQRDASVEELKRVLELARNPDVSENLQERIVEEVVGFFSHFQQSREGCCTSMS